MALSAEQRTARARIAALARWAKENPKPQGFRGQVGLRAKYEREAREADPDASDAEIERRTDVMLRLHIERMVFARSRAKSEREAARRAGAS
jgi:hypothetical protein